MVVRMYLLKLALEIYLIIRASQLTITVVIIDQDQTRTGVEIPSLNDVQLWIGITSDVDLYYFPHHSGLYKPIGSLSKTKINHTKNNTAILDNFFNYSWLITNVLHPISDYSSWK